MKLEEVAHALFRALTGCHVFWFGQFWAPQWKMPMDLVKQNQFMGNKIVKGLGDFSQMRD